MLFTNSAAANEHIVTDAQIDDAVADGDAIEIPLPQLTFHCESVPAAVFETGLSLKEDPSGAGGPTKPSLL